MFQVNRRHGSFVTLITGISLAVAAIAANSARRRARRHELRRVSGTHVYAARPADRRIGNSRSYSGGLVPAAAARNPATVRKARLRQHTVAKTSSHPIRSREFPVGDEVPGLKGAVRKLITIHLGNDEQPRIDVLLYLPADTTATCTLFLGLNFYGNQTVHDDPRIPINPRWMRGRWSRRGRSPRDGRISGRECVAMASRIGTQAGLRPGHGLLRRHRSGQLQP